MRCAYAPQAPPPPGPPPPATTCSRVASVTHRTYQWEIGCLVDGVGEGASLAHAPRFPYRLGINGTVWGFGLKIELHKFWVFTNLISVSICLTGHNCPICKEMLRSAHYAQPLLRLTFCSNIDLLEPYKGVLVHQNVYICDGKWTRGSFIFRPIASILYCDTQSRIRHLRRGDLRSASEPRTSCFSHKVKITKKSHPEAVSKVSSVCLCF